MNELQAGGHPGATTGDDEVGGTNNTVMAADIATLNGMAVARAAAFARIAGTALVGVGLAGVVAWLWIALRTQLSVGDSRLNDFGSAGSSGPSLLERIDYAAATLNAAVLAALAVGAGVLIRLGADYTVARTGGSLTGFQVGDIFPVDQDEDADVI